MVQEGLVGPPSPSQPQLRHQIMTALRAGAAQECRYKTQKGGELPPFTLSPIIAQLADSTAPSAHRSGTGKAGQIRLRRVCIHRKAA